MALVQFNPHLGLTDLRDNINRLFDTAFPSGWSSGSESADWQPSVDAYEKDGETVVRAELPGVKKEDISVDIREGTLMIQGKRTNEEEIDEGGYYRRERFSGSFQRALPLPRDVEPDHVKANYRDGVLEVRILASELNTAKRIPIE